jgi:hypothetical protein
MSACLFPPADFSSSRRYLLRQKVRRFHVFVVDSARFDWFQRCWKGCVDVGDLERANSRHIFVFQHQKGGRAVESKPSYSACSSRNKVTTMFFLKESGRNLEAECSDRCLSVHVYSSSSSFFLILARGMIQQLF